MTRPALASTAAAWHISRYVAERTRIDGMHSSTNTSRDPDKYAVDERRDETADVWRNTGRGWVWVADFNSRQDAERWVAEREEEEA